ncbi:hypothetical protein [Nocardioides zeae]|uniref:Uncharacterized protein n=1 Tax=Nocardioides zeae TaxID=1457234 RepID=A0AAJ1X0Y8_9ACTN|nr:hypothetical protein [Nocardioides zeae]MDQ1102864.1 hypothetical protein [Nocardioides zeae]
MRRPALLIHLLKDPELEARASGVLVTSDASRVDGDGANGLWERLSSPRLLPTVLVDGSRHENAAAADYAAAESVGLAEVAHLNGGALAALAPQLAEIDARIPPGGAVLVWPDLTLRHKWWTSGNLHNLPGDLVRVVAPLSVRARGVNALARTAAAAERDERNRLFEERLHASETADMTATVATQAAQIQELTRQEAAWVEEIENLETQLEETQQLARQAEFWRYEAARLRDSTSNDDAEPAWSNLPRLTPSDITSLARDLERRTDRAISFTPRVARAWTRSRYPHVDAMESALVALAKAAEEYRASGAQTGGFPDDWFKTLHNLNMAGTDKGLRQTGEDTFTFEDTKYSREPHLKLDDVVSPNEVGRVYFALDSAQLRIIVDHVGLKLYGL